MNNLFLFSPLCYCHINLRFGELDDHIGEFTVPKSYVFAASAMTMRGWSTDPSTWKARIAFARSEN